MTNCILYARFSPRPDADTSESNLAQFDFCRHYAAGQGWRVLAEHQDADASGSDEDRPGLWSAIDSLKRGQVLLIYKLDRLARSVYLSHTIEQAVAKLGARIVSVVGEGTWADTPEDMLIRRILQVLAEYQKLAQAARTKAAMLRHQANGKRMTAAHCCPLGMQADPESAPNKKGQPGGMKENPAEAQAISRVKELRALGLSPRAIAARLNEEGLPSRGQRWYHSAVERILKRLPAST